MIANEVYAMTLGSQNSLPHMPKLYDVWVSTFEIVLLSEFIEGEDASKLAYSRAQHRSVSRQLFLGLGAAHALGITHQDVKPANLMVERATGKLLIIDWGFAIIRTPGDPGEVLRPPAGTPLYYSLGLAMQQIKKDSPFSSVYPEDLEHDDNHAALLSIINLEIDQTLGMLFDPRVLIDYSKLSEDLREFVTTVVRNDAFMLRFNAKTFLQHDFLSGAFDSAPGTLADLSDDLKRSREKGFRLTSGGVKNVYGVGENPAQDREMMRLWHKHQEIRKNAEIK